MLGLDTLTDSLVASLAAATGVQNPSPEGSSGEAKELAALSTLVGLASGEEAGFLGSGWVTVLRTLSALDLLKVPPLYHPPPPLPDLVSRDIPAIFLCTILWRRQAWGVIVPRHLSALDLLKMTLPPPHLPYTLTICTVFAASLLPD